MPRLSYPKLAPEAYEKLLAVGHYLTTGTALDPVLLELVYLRASTLNGCGFCIGMHTAELKKHHEPQTRIDAIANWQASDAFTLRERATLAWTDAITNIQSSHASDTDYAAVSEFFTGKDLVDLTVAIAQINSWNRLGIAFGAEWKPSQHSKPLETA
jgi:AhpD family alkylhydroperoxidase